MDQSGSLRWLLASDPGPKATVGEVARAVRSKSPPTNQGGGRWRKPKQPGGSPTAASRVRSLEAALKGLGPEEQAIRAGLEVSWAAAREKVAKFRGHDRSRGRCKQERTRQSTSCGTRGALERTDCGVQGIRRTCRETVAQVGSRRSCRKCIIGARPNTCCVGGRSSRSIASAPPAPTAVSWLEAELSRLWAELATTRTATPGDQPAKKPILREDFAPITVEEARL